MCGKLWKLSHEYVNERSVICASLAGQRDEEAEGEPVHSEDHLTAEPPGDDPSQWMWEWCAHHPDPNGCRTCWKVLYNSRAGDVINKGVKFTGRQNPLLWWSATIPHWKQGIFVDPTRNILEKVGQIWAGTRNMRGTRIQLGLKLDFWWHVVVILPAVYLKFQKNNLFISHRGVD